MDAAVEVQRLLQLIRDRLRHKSGLRQPQLSYQHFVEAYEDVTATFDAMAACKLPMCLILDSAASVALSLFRMELSVLGLQVLRLKSLDAQQFLRQVAEAGDEMPSVTGKQDNCAVCARYLRIADEEHTGGFLLRRESSSSPLGKHLHLLQAATRLVLLYACATASHYPCDDRRYAEADKLEAILRGIESLEVLIAAWDAVSKPNHIMSLPVKLVEPHVFVKQAVLLTSKLCCCLNAGGYNNTAGEVLSRCLNRVAPPMQQIVPFYWPFWWQMSHQLAARGEWSEAQKICISLLSAISAAVDETSANHWRRDAAYKQLLFTAMLIKCKVWLQAMQLTDAFEELQAAVKVFVTTVWPDSSPPQRQAKNARSHGGNMKANVSSPCAADISLGEHLRRVQQGARSGGALVGIGLFDSSIVFRRLLISFSLSLLQPESLNSPTDGINGTAVVWSNNLRLDDLRTGYNTPESESVDDLRGPAAKRRESPKGLRRKRQLPVSLSSSNGPLGSAESFLLKVLEVAEPLLSDLQMATTKLEVLFKADAPRELKTAAAAAGEAGVRDAIATQDSAGHVRKKGVRQSTAPTQNTAGIGGPIALQDTVKEAVRGAQRAAASLPLPAHTELLWRVAELREAAVPTGRLTKIWRTLESRFAYTHLFCPPVTDLEVFELALDAVDSKRSLQQLEDLIRSGWVLASSCDLQLLQHLEEITVTASSGEQRSSAVSTDEDMQTNARLHQQRLAFEQDAVPSSSQQSETRAIPTSSPARCMRLLLARFWDWESCLDFCSVPPPSDAAALSAPASLPAEVSLHSQQAEQAPKPVVSEGSRTSTPKPLSEILSSVPLICNMQRIVAKTFEEAAAKYKVKLRNKEDATRGGFDGRTSNSLYPEDGGHQPHAQRVLEEVYELNSKAAHQRPQLRRTHKALQLLTSAATVYHNDTDISRQLADKGLPAFDVLQEISADAATVKSKSEQRHIERSDAKRAPEGQLTNTDTASIHVLRLVSYEDAVEEMHEFLVYTKLAVATAEHGLAYPSKAPRISDQDDLQALAGQAQEVFIWRMRGGPRSAVQTCLGIHLDIFCTPEGPSSWLLPPLPCFNSLLEPPTSPMKTSQGPGLMVWTESEVNMPLCVVALQLHTWSVLRLLDAAATDARGEWELSSWGAATYHAAEPETCRSPSGDRTVNPNAYPVRSCLDLRLRLLLELVTAWSEAFNAEGVEELLKHLASDYITHVLITLWHFHVLPLATILLLSPPKQLMPCKVTSGSEHVEISEAAVLEKVLQLMAGIMIKSKFPYLRPLAALTSLLFHANNQPLHQPKGRELLRGIIARAECCASEIAMPLLGAREAQEINALLSSADPVAHLEQYLCKGSEVINSKTSPIPRDLFTKENCNAFLQWDAEPAEAWTLLCTMYDIEARVASKPSRDALNTSQTRQFKAISKEEPSPQSPVGVKLANNNGDAKESKEENMNYMAEASKYSRELKCGRNWYRKCLALCALAESLPRSSGAPLVAAAEEEAAAAAGLEARGIVVPFTNEQVKYKGNAQRQAGAPLVVGRGPQSLLLRLPCTSPSTSLPLEQSKKSWKVLFGGPVRTHGGMGVSRNQREIVGCGIRLEANEVARIQALNKTEIYLVAYEEINETRESKISETTLPLSCSWPLPLGMLRARIYHAAMSCSLQRTAEGALNEMWHLVGTLEPGVKGEKPKRWRLKETAIARLPPYVLRSIAESTVCCFREQTNPSCLLKGRTELIAVLESLLRQMINLELAVYSHSADIVEEQLAIMLNTLHVLFSSLPSFHFAILMPILRALTAIDTFPQESLSPSARVMEAAFLGFACLAASQFQIPVINSLTCKHVPRSLALSSTACNRLNSMEKQVLLSAWLSASIVAVFSSPFSPPVQPSQLLDGLPPPAWIFDPRSSDSKQLRVLLATVLLAASGEMGSSVQRLIEFARNHVRQCADREDIGLACVFGPILCVALKRRIRHALWMDISDAEELIREAELVLEAAAPTVAAALHGTVRATFETHANSAEPLVEWLNRDRSSSCGTAASAATGDASGNAEASQNSFMQARQVYTQRMELERNLRAAVTEANAVLKDETATTLWLATLSALLMAPPLQLISQFRRAASEDILSPENVSTQQTHGLYDFASIAANPLLDADGSNSTTGKSLSKVEQEGTVADDVTNANALSRSSGASSLNNFNTTSMHAPLRSDKRSERPESESAKQMVPASVIPYKALFLLFQRAAVAASRAVASEAPLLAYSVIMQLGNALLLLAPDAPFIAACQEEPCVSHLNEATATLPETPSTSKDPSTATARDAMKGGEVAGGGRAAKRSDSKGATRTPGPPRSASPNSGRSKPQQKVDARYQSFPVWVAAGVLAQACADLLLLVFRDYLQTIDKDEINAINNEEIAKVSGMSTGEGISGFQSALEATELSYKDDSPASPDSKGSNRIAVLCQQAFNLKKINTSHLGAVFIFCIRVLLHRDRMHQVVALCRRFSLLGRGPPFRCALTLAHWAQQMVISAKEAAVRKVQEYRITSTKAQEEALERLEETKASVALEKEQMEQVQTATQAKRRATRGVETKTDNAATALVTAAHEAAQSAEEIASFWVEREAFMSESLGRQVQVGSWLKTELSRSHRAVLSEEKLLQELHEARRSLWKAKQSNSDAAFVERLLHKVLNQHRKAVPILRREQQFEDLCAVLRQLGDLSWLSRNQELAGHSWREAVEACFWRRNILHDWMYLPDEFFTPEEGQIDIRLASFLPLYRWARLAHRRSYHEQLHAALLASRILWGILRASADNPLPTHAESDWGETQFYSARSDGRLIRHRIKYLHGRLLQLPTSMLSPTPDSSRAAAAELVEALVWFACSLRCCDFTRTKAFPFLAVAEYVAADVCRNIQMATHCRLVRSLLCIQCGDLQAAHWQLREIAWGVGTSVYSFSERGEFPSTLFEGGDSAMCQALHLEGVAAGGNERQQNHQQREPVHTFSNALTLRNPNNAAARDELWGWRLHSRLMELYGGVNSRRFSLARASWMFAVSSNLSAPHIEPDEVARRLVCLEQVGSLLIALLRDIIQDTDAHIQGEGLVRPTSPSQDSSMSHQVNKAKVIPDRVSLNKVVDTLRTRLQDSVWTKAFPREDTHFALMLLSQVQEALGHMDAAYEIAETAAFTASSSCDTGDGFALEPVILSGVQAWQRVARLLLCEGRFSETARLARHLIYLASGGLSASLEQAKWSETAKPQAGQPSTCQREPSWLPQPPSAPGLNVTTVPLEGTICAPGVVTELLVILAEAQVCMGYPEEAIRLCKWARYYARETHVDGGFAFANASQLASHILAECPGLLGIAQTDDAKVNNACNDSLEVRLGKDVLETDTAARWSLITSLTKEALQRMEEQPCKKPHALRDSILDTDEARTRQSLPHTSQAEADEKSRLEQSSGEKRQQPQVDMCFLSAPPVLHHLEDHSEHVNPDKYRDQGTTWSLYNPWSRQRVALLLDFADQLQHQTSQSAEYCNVVSMTGEQLRALGEPSPTMCVRVWLHQLRCYRLQLERKVGTSQVKNITDTKESSYGEDQAANITEHFLRYFRVVTLATKFVDLYCGSDLHLHRSLFAEALLLSVLLLTISKLFTPHKLPGGMQMDKVNMLKQAALGGTRLCMMAFCRMEQMRQRATCLARAVDTDATLDSSCCHKALARLFRALQSSYFTGRGAEDVIAEDSITCGAAWKVFEEATRRCGLRKTWLSVEQQVPNTLYLILFNLPSFQGTLGLSSHFASSSFADAPSPSDTKKEVQKAQANETQGQASSFIPKGPLECILPLQASQNNAPAVAQLLWLPHNAASEESINLLRRDLEAPYPSTTGSNAAGNRPSSPTTIFSMTSRCHFSLTLADRMYQSTQAKGNPPFPTQDLALLVAVFCGQEVTRTSANTQTGSKGNELALAVCVKACSRQRIQALASACYSASLEWKKSSTTLQVPIGQGQEPFRSEDELLESRTLDLFAHVFVALSDGKRVTMSGYEDMHAFEKEYGDYLIASGSKADALKVEQPNGPLEHLNLASLVHASTRQSSSLVRETSRIGANSAKRRQRSRKSIADFLFETSGIERTSLEAERLESYSVASRLLAELKREHRSAEDRIQKPTKPADRPPSSKDKSQRPNLLPTPEENTTGTPAHTVAASLGFLSSFLSASAVAVDCKLIPVARFLCQALSKHQTAVLTDLNERKQAGDQNGMRTSSK